MRLSDSEGAPMLPECSVYLLSGFCGGLQPKILPLSRTLASVRSEDSFIAKIELQWPVHSHRIPDRDHDLNTLARFHQLTVRIVSKDGSDQRDQSRVREDPPFFLVSARFERDFEEIAISAGRRSVKLGSRRRREIARLAFRLQNATANSCRVSASSKGEDQRGNAAEPLSLFSFWIQ